MSSTSNTNSGLPIWSKNDIQTGRTSKNVFKKNSFQNPLFRAPKRSPCRLSLARDHRGRKRRGTGSAGMAAGQPHGAFGHAEKIDHYKTMTQLYTIQEQKHEQKHHGKKKNDENITYESLPETLGFFESLSEKHQTQLSQLNKLFRTTFVAGLPYLDCCVSERGMMFGGQRTQTLLNIFGSCVQ